MKTPPFLGTFLLYRQSYDQAMIKFSTIPILPCSYYPECSGCTLITEELFFPPQAKELEAFLQKVSPSLPFYLYKGEVTGWRTRAKLAIRGSSTACAIGLFERGTHQVVAIPNCPLHHPAITKALHLLQEAIQAFKIEPYNEETRTGLLRYLQMTVERKSGSVQLVLVLHTEKTPPEIFSLFEQLKKEDPALWHSFWINGQTSFTNRIFGERWVLYEGYPFVWEQIGGIFIALHPACFSQAHLPLFEKMLHSLKMSLHKGKKVVEYYAGVGAIGFTLLSECERVVCCEINPYAEMGFYLSQAQLPSSLQEKISFLCRSTEEALFLLKENEVVIVDPPRKGLSRAFLEALIHSPSIEQLIYISCHGLSFQRDASFLLEAGWKLEKCEGYLFFPGSDHVEILGVFTPPG